MVKSRFYVQCGIYQFSLTAAAQCVYFYLCKCANKEGICFPGRKNISKNTGISLTTVSRAIKELKEKGVVDYKPQFEDRGTGTYRQTSNLYKILTLGKRNLYGADKGIRMWVSGEKYR